MSVPKMDVLAWLDSLHATTEGGAVTADKWPEAQAAHAVVAKLIEREAALRSALQGIVASLAEHDDEGMIEHAQQMIAARAALALGGDAA